ncbi:hypothetical protein QP181_01405 [Sphingomonas sp. LR55]
MGFDRRIGSVAPCLGPGAWQFPARYRAIVIAVQRRETNRRGAREFADVDPAVAIAVGGNDRLGKVEEPEPRRTLAFSGHGSLAGTTIAKAHAVTAASAPVSTAAVSTAPVIATPPAPIGHAAAADDADFRDEDVFVKCDVVRVDFPVLAAIEHREKAHRVVLELRQRKASVTIRIRSSEPKGLRGAGAKDRAKRLAHWADEQLAAATLRRIAGAREVGGTACQCARQPDEDYASHRDSLHVAGQKRSAW